MQRPSGPPLPWVSSGWQTGYKKIPYLPVYPHFGQQVTSMIFFIFCIFLSLCFCTFRTLACRLCRLTTQEEATKASPSLTREAKRLPHCRGTLGISTCAWCLIYFFRSISTSTWNDWNTAEVFQLVLDTSIELCWSQEREPLVQHDHKKASRRTCRGYERCVIWSPVYCRRRRWWRRRWSIV